ncbi:MAG: 3-isopropylmalate dehydratase [Verrucomicrobiota bacterium]|nr:3-isopropylmalate dehydratase [Verrucomicrobiota bacterium]
MSEHIIKGKIFVCANNIDTDQIIPAQYLNLVPTIPDEYEKLGSYAMIGLPDQLYPVRYVKDGESKTEFPIIVAGRNFGCGSSREHAPIALGAAGCKAVIAELYARIFYRNCIATGELYPVDSVDRLCEKVKTGDDGVIDLEKSTLTVNGKDVYSLKGMGEAKDVIDAGGIFNYARKNGMIAPQT